MQAKAILENSAPLQAASRVFSRTVPWNTALVHVLGIRCPIPRFRLTSMSSQGFPPALSGCHGVVAFSDRKRRSGSAPGRLDRLQDRLRDDLVPDPAQVDPVVDEEP